VTIYAYLAALESLLPRTARFRVLAEVREHLADAAAQHQAAGLSPFESEAAATRDFGSVEEVARRLGSELALRETRLASVLALIATVLFVFPLYVVPENTLPPAPWPEKPTDIALLQQVSLGLWLVACALAVVAVAVAWTRLSRLTPVVLLAGALALSGAIAVSVALVIRWFSLTPATPNWALAAPLALASLVACVGAALWARSSRERLVPHL